MRHRRSARSSSIGLILCLVLFGARGVYANPVLATEQSLGSGAQLFELYCSECHGRASEKRAIELVDTANAPDDSELINIALGAASPAASQPVEEEEWPEWATPRDPDLEDEPDMNAEVLSAVTAAMEEARVAEAGSAPSDTTGGLAEKNRGNGFTTPFGATDLSAPQTFFYGTSEEDLFKSIAQGTGAAMPGWRTELGSDEAIWDLVNYIRSFWSEEWIY